MRFNLVRCFIISLVVLLLPVSVLAQDSPSTPVEVQLTVDQTTVEMGEFCQATLILRNTAAYTLTNVSARLQATAFAVANSTDLPDILAPYSSAQAEYTLTSQSTGSQNIVFAVQYFWDDPNTGFTHHWIETVSVEEVEATPALVFNWPNYLIPLLMGFAIGQLGSWLADWRKQHREDRERERQVRGITLAILQAARRGVKKGEKVTFNLWEEAVVEGNLYPALHRLGRKTGNSDLSKQLAELSITLANYNERQAKENLTESLIADLSEELTDLIRTVENA